MDTFLEGVPEEEPTFSIAQTTSTDTKLSQSPRHLRRRIAQERAELCIISIAKLLCLLQLWIPLATGPRVPLHGLLEFLVGLATTAAAENWVGHVP